MLHWTSVHLSRWARVRSPFKFDSFADSAIIPSWTNKDLKKFLIDNSNQICLMMVPDDDYIKNLEKEEESLLQEQLNQMNEDELQKIVEMV